MATASRPRLLVPGLLPRRSDARDVSRPPRRRDRRRARARRPADRPRPARRPARRAHRRRRGRTRGLRGARDPRRRARRPCCARSSRRRPTAQRAWSPRSRRTGSTRRRRPRPSSSGRARPPVPRRRSARRVPCVVVVGAPAGERGRGRRGARVRSAARGQPLVTARRGGARAARAARRAAPRLRGSARVGARVRGEGGRVHPGARHQGAAVLGLPRVPRRQAAGRRRARARCDDDAHADGQRLPAARPLRQVLRPGSGSAGRGRARHGRPARHLRARVQREVLRGHGVLRARQLLGQLQRAAAAVHDRAAQGLAGAQLLLQHGVRPARTCSSATSRGRARATTCCCAR